MNICCNFLCYSAGWVDCWTTPIVSISVSYTYHPCPTIGEQPYTNPDSAHPISTPEAEEMLLIPLRLVQL